MKRSDKAFALSAFALAAAAGLALSAESAAQPAIAAEAALSEEQGSGPTVSVVTAEQTAFTETVLVTGSLIARNEVLVTPQIEGLRIREILAEEGDRVAAGQVLARLVDDTLKAQLAQLEANLLRAGAAIAQARSGIAQAEANRKQADAAFARAQELAKSGTMSRSVYDEREAAARTAAATLASAKDGLTVAEAEKAQTEAQIREAKLKLGFTNIVAPAAGLISRRTAKVGALASAVADPLFRIIENGEVELDAEVPEIYLPRIRVGEPGRVEVAGLKSREGKVRLISPEVDPATRLGKVRVFIGDDPELRVGSFARASIDTGTKTALGIPATAVLNRDSGPTVQVVKDGRVQTRTIGVGVRSGQMVEVVDGLKAGEQVVLKSGMLLRDGDAVRAVPASEKTVSEAE
ncbi:MAG: efflux RND transporter periplasmic adaptor subunit [Rhodomicrobium sp.]|nr:efflux RND transporter periplasmic adaptor subunit [Rhodomicrobium sp.]